jgi:predicted alpha/beta hydrolase family esterase
MQEFNFLTVPGLGSSGAAHWQSLWEKQNPEKFRRVEQISWDLPVCHEWVERLDEEVRKLTKSTYLIAHSLGCLTVVHWANKYSSEMIKGAFLVAPPDVENSRRLSFIEGFSPIPTVKLPFKTVLIASTTDQYASIERANEFANWWGSEFINIGKKGHINAISNLENWEKGQDLLENFINQ